nr:NADH dehydrogenase subunit 6 [Brachionus calyciflorus]
MTILLSLLFISMFVYVNTLYYSMVLLAIMMSLNSLKVNYMMMMKQTLKYVTWLIFGDMMILIGYTCAIYPNLILTPSPLSSLVYSGLILNPLVLMTQSFSADSKKTYDPLTSFLNTKSVVIFLMSLMLKFSVILYFLTDQYMTPKGPFRSVSI